MERHESLETLVKLYLYIITCLHSMVTRALYPLLTEVPVEAEAEPASDDESSDDDREEDYDDWKWDRDTKVKAEGLRSSLTSGTNIAALVVLKNGLHPVKGLSVKLQKRDRDICEAYSHIDFVVSEVQSMRQNVDETWEEWYSEACSLANDVGATMGAPRTTRVQQHRSNAPADTPRSL